METKSHVYQTGGLMIDDESKTVTVDGDEVHLTPVQYKILTLLTANAGRVFSIEDIYEKVWNEPAFNRKIQWLFIFEKLEKKLKSIRKSQNI